MLKEGIQQHFPKCPGNDEESLDNAALVAKAENLLCRFSSGEAPAFIGEIQNTTIRDIIYGDEALLAYGRYTVDSKGQSKNQIKCVKSKVTKLAKVLVDMREKRKSPTL